MKKIIILILLLGVISPVRAIYFKHIGMQEGLSQLSVMSIYQDELGRMWFGTEEGLSVYDGTRTIAYKPSDFQNPAASVIGNQIEYIAGDEKGNIFFNSDNMLIKYDIRRQKFTRLREKNVQALTSYKGRILVSISDSIFEIDPVDNSLKFGIKLEKEQHYATALLVDSQKRVWIGTNTGLYVKEENAPLDCVIPYEDIYNLFEDSKHNLWISVRMNGLYKREPSGKFVRYRYDRNNPNNISSNQVRGFAEDNFGNIWFGTFTGLNKYNPRSNRFYRYTHTSMPGSLSHSSVFPVYKDKQGSIWLGTYYGGVNYFNPEMDLFTMYSSDATRNDCLSYPFVGHMVEDKDQNIWICTEGGGLNFFDRNTKKFTFFKSDPNRNSIAHNNLKDIAYSPEHNKLYIGTHTGGLSIYDLRTRKFRNPYFEDPHYAVLAGDRIIRMKIWKNYLIFSSQRGLIKMDLDTERLSPLFESEKYYGGGCFLIDSKGYLWSSYGKKVMRVKLDDEKDIRFFHCGEQGLGKFDVTQIFEDKKGRIFLGTNGSGLFYFDEEKAYFTGYTTENSLLLSNYCYEIVQSTQGYLIVTSDKGLTFFDPDLKVFKVVELGTALPIAGINSGCGILVGRNGEIFVGGINGMTTFFEQQLLRREKSTTCTSPISLSTTKRYVPAIIPAF